VPQHRRGSLRAGIVACVAVAVLLALTAAAAAAEEDDMDYYEQLGVPNTATSAEVPTPTPETHQPPHIPRGKSFSSASLPMSPSVRFLFLHGAPRVLGLALPGCNLLALLRGAISSLPLLRAVLYSPIFVCTMPGSFWSRFAFLALPCVAKLCHVSLSCAVL